MIAALLVAAAAAAPACLRYEPSVVELRGRIVERWQYGPPGFGEDPKHDRREDYLLLKLARPICVDASPGDAINSDAEHDVRALMIVPPQGRRLPRGAVVVTGTLFHGFTAHHATAVLVEVKSAYSAKTSK